MGVDLARGFHQLLGVDRLVDDLAHALGGGFGGQGKPAALAQVFELVHQLDREGFDAQRGQGDRQAAVAKAVGDGLHQL